MKVLVLPDKQIRPNNLDLNMPLMRSLGRLIVEERPDVIVDMGDHWDMFSLNQYDNKKKHPFNGDEVMADIKAGKLAMRAMLQPLRNLQKKQRKNKHKVYNPAMFFLIGNHEERIKRFPELTELVGYHSLLSEFPFTVVDYLKPVKIGGVLFAHYFYNQLSGKPIGGSAEYRINKLKCSFVQGHEQSFRFHQEPTTDGRILSALVGGSCYLHDEDYKGYQGNNHFRGCFMLHDVNEGVYDLEQISCNRIMREYKWNS